MKTRSALHPARSARRPRLRTGALVVVCGIGLSLGTIEPGGADAPFGAVDARASADAFRLGVSVRKFLIVENFVDAGGPSAQARLTSVGSESFAALPDPGGLVINYNTFVGLALGQGLPLSYPFYAAAKFPGSPEAETADPAGSYRVSAKAAADSADALAQMRPTAGDVVVSGAAARSNIKVEGSTLTAASETVADAVALSNGALELSGVVSRSVTTRRAGQSDAATETSLSVDLLTVNDMKVRYGRNGFEFLGTPIPAPAETVEAALAQALKPLGIEIDVVHPATFTGGARAAMLEIRQAAPLPAGESQIVLRLGGAVSSITAEEALPAPGLPGSVPPAVGTDPADQSGAVPGGESIPADAPSSSSFSVGTVTTGSRAVGGSALPAAFGQSAPPSLPTGGAQAAVGAGLAAAEPPTPPVAMTPPAAVGRAELAGHRKSVEGPYAALVAGGLAIVLLSAAWARRSAAAALWAGQ